MRRFDLAFPIGEDDERWLVPQRLADAQPPLGDEWRETNCTRLRYRYAALPEGLLPRFITRTYPLSEETGVRWVNGVVLEWGGARGLVKADREERLVTACVTDGGVPGVESASLQQSSSLSREAGGSRTRPQPPARPSTLIPSHST